MDRKSVFVVAGEVSGDMNVARLVTELRRRDPTIDVMGVGGTYLAAAGASLFLDSSLWGTIGYLRPSHVLLVPRLWQIERQIRRVRPDLLLLVDFPTFNLQLARRLRGLLPIVYYFPPMVSIRRGDRARRIAALGMRLLACFRAEAEAYRVAGADVVFVGHPAVDLARPRWDPPQARVTFGIPSGAPVVGLLPGSRVAEIRGHLPIMLAAAARLHRDSPDLWFVLPLASERFRGMVEEMTAASRLPLRVVTQTYDAMAISRALIVATGTATLEAAILGVPMVGIYRLPWLSWVIAHRVLKIRRAALPNVLSGRDVMPERLQHRMTPEALAAAAGEFLNDPAYAARVREDLLAVAAGLGEPGVVPRAAAEVRAVLDRAVAAARDGTVR